MEYFFRDLIPRLRAIPETSCDRYVQFCSAVEASSVVCKYDHTASNRTFLRLNIMNINN